MGLAADQIREANTNVGDVVKLVDVSGGTPGLPTTDGRRLTNVLASSQSRDLPGLYFLGDVLSFNTSAALPAGEVQYTRVYLPAGVTITKLATYIPSGGATGRNVRLGLYDQATPASDTGVPRDLVASTAATDTNGLSGLQKLNLSASYLVPTTGYYWIAIVTDSTGLKIAVTSAITLADFAPVRRQTVSGTTLAATASGLTNPASATAFAAAVE